MPWDFYESSKFVNTQNDRVVPSVASFDKNSKIEDHWSHVLVISDKGLVYCGVIWVMTKPPDKLF